MGSTKEECIAKAKAVVESNSQKAASDGLSVELKLDYIEMNDAKTFDILESQARRQGAGEHLVILSGALYVDKTRLIDNILLGDATNILG